MAFRSYIAGVFFFSVFVTFPAFSAEDTFTSNKADTSNRADIDAFTQTDVSGQSDEIILAPLPASLIAARDRAEGLQPVKMAYFDFPPYIYARDGKITGSIASLAHEMMIEAGLEYEFISMPVSRIYREMAGGGVHFWIGTQGAAEMVGTTLVGTSVVGTSRLNIYGLAGNKPPRFEDLRDTAIIILKGYAYGGRGDELAARSDLHLLAAHNHASAFLMLQAGRAPYLLDYHTPSKQTILDLGMYGLKETNVYERPNHLNVSKKSPHPELLSELLETGIRRAYARRRSNAQAAMVQQ